jgi:hypothetical protein
MTLINQAFLKPPRMIMMSTYAASDFAEMLDASPHRHCHFWVI